MAPSPPQPHAHTVLLVEDDTGTREAMEVLLTTHGCGVISARSAGTALTLVRSERRPCIILLDLMMSDVSGDEFRRAQLADPTARDIPVIVVSGAHDLASRAQSLNAAAYLRKPLDIDALLVAIARTCVAETALA
ncbi:MAG TPA: response regulator [Gemmatimonadales bacterium]